MESCCSYRFIKTVNVSSFYYNGGGYVHQYNDTLREFRLHLSYSKLKNAATTTACLYTLLDRMFEKKQMIRRGQFWDQTYGCAKRYRCSIFYYLMSFLSKSYQMFLDRAVYTPGHGKYGVDGFNAVQKRYLATFLRMRSTTEKTRLIVSVCLFIP